MEVYFIVNEHAGNGRGKKVWKKLESKLDFPFTVYKTEFPKHANAIVSKLKTKLQHPSLFIAIGGDGTINEVISGAAGSKHIIISAIKAGSGNDFARGYRVFQHYTELNAYVKQQKLNAKEIDLGVIQSSQANGSFINNAGFGFDALVATKVNQSNVKAVLNKVGLGRLAYVWLTIKLLFTFKTFTAHAKIDQQDHTFNNVWFIATCNQPYFGGGMKISPRSIVDDGVLDVVVVQHLSPVKLLLLFVSVFTGQHEKIKEVSFFKAKHVQLSFEDHVISHTDGDLFMNIEPKDKVDITVAANKWLLAN